MRNQYKMNIQVTSFDVGPQRELRYSMIFKLLQEAAGLQMEQDGMSYEILREKGVVFLLTKAAVLIKSLPHAGDYVEVCTWFRGLRGVQFLRQMRLTDEKGVALAEVESLWLTVHPQSHKILRPAAFPFPEKMQTFTDDDVEVKINKFRPPEYLEPVGTREVRWSDIDRNGHMNNAVYADILCDYYPGGLQEKKLKEITIDYIGEVAEGAYIRMETLVGEQGAVYFRGITGEKKCFEAYVL